MKHLKWEYRVEYRLGGNDFLAELKDAGLRGWELCGVVGKPEAPSDLSGAWPSVVRYYLKRPLK